MFPRFFMQANLTVSAKVGRALTGDADADMSGLDHGDVVSAVADGERDGLLVPLDEVDHHRLLKRRHSTAHYRLALTADIQERPFQSRRECVMQRWAVDHQRIACK